MAPRIIPLKFRAMQRKGCVAPAAAVLFMLATPMAEAGAPELGLRPPPRPDLASEWRKRERTEAAARRDFERRRREDWLDWQRDRGGTYDQWLRERGEAERALGEARRKNWLDRQKPQARDDDLGAELDALWRRQQERFEDRGAGRLGPGTLRRDTLWRERR